MRTFHIFLHFLIGVLQEFSIYRFSTESDNHCQLFRWIQNCRSVNTVCRIYQAVLEDICDRLGLLRAQLPLCAHSLVHLLSIQNFCVKILADHIISWYLHIYNMFFLYNQYHAICTRSLYYARSYPQT